MSDPQHELSAFIAGVRRRWQLRTWARTVGLATLAAAAVLGLAVLFDRLGHPHGLALIALATTSILLTAVLLGLSFWRMPRRPDDRRVARFIEERASQDPACGPLDDAVVTAVSLDA